MHTARRPSRLLAATAALGLGCAGLSGCHSHVSPNVRTVASVGDKTYPVITGPPGEAVASGGEEREPRSRYDSRVSGRVVDDRGDPVPNARVRLAVNGVSRGRVIRTTTDEAGRFTLKGLRPGTAYTVIAEADDERGVIEGRGEVRAPSTEVRIALQEAGKPGAATPGRINPASNRRETDDEEELTRRPRVNEEDLPPAPEAEALAPADRGESSRRPIPRLAAPVSSSRWHKANEGDSGSAPTDPMANRSSAVEEPSPEPASRPDPAPEPAAEDEERNPLPSAIEPGQETEPTASRARPQRPAPGALALAAPAARKPRPKPSSTSSRPAPAPKPADPAPDPPGDTPPRDIKLDATPTPLDPAPRAQATPGGGPTWDDLVRQYPEMASARPARPASTPTRGNPSATAPTVAVRDASFTATARTRLASQVVDDNKAFCRFNTRQQRLVDFGLPDLQGRPFHFQDLDADLILVDFWGTWCGPCLQAIPHLVELQQKYGPGRFQVVGIAYEEGPTAERVAQVREVANRLGITYPLVLGGLDGPCPIQAAFHVKVYPTMILFDRQGNILWRDQGASPAAIARLDRVLSARAGISRQ